MQPDGSARAGQGTAPCINEGQDPLSAQEDLRKALRVKDTITLYIAEHLPKPAKHNAGNQTSMLRKMFTFAVVWE
jgi:hypothetical protein